MEALKKIFAVLKLLFEHKAMIVWLFGLCGGMLYQCSEIIEKDAEIKDTQAQVTAVANHMTKHEEVDHKPVKQVVPVVTEDICNEAILNHERRKH